MCVINAYVYVYVYLYISVCIYMFVYVDKNFLELATILAYFGATDYIVS